MFDTSATSITSHSDATITVPGVEDSSDPGVPSAPGEPTEGPVPAASDVDLASTWLDDRVCNVGSARG